MRAYSMTLAVAMVSASAPAPVSQTPVHLWPCASGSAFQTWDALHTMRLGGVAGLPYTGLILNTLGFSNASGGELNVWTTTPGGSSAQTWTFSSSTSAVSSSNGLCAGTANSTGVLPAGTAVVQVPCFAHNAYTSWTWDAATGLLRWGGDATLCLDAGSPQPTCTDAGAPPFCNVALSAEARAANLISLMLPTEKAAMLAASNNGVPRLGVPPLRYGEALHGVLSGCGAAAPPAGGFASTGCPTSFPTGLALGSTFNRTLWGAVGTVIGTEARALFNQGHIAQLMLFTPDSNPLRDIRWGRGFEVPSEDPYHAGEYAAAYVSGLQGIGEGGGFVRAVSMLKHFAGYDQEGNFGPHDRTHFCAPISLRSLVDYFFPPFRAAVERGHAGGIMCAASGYGVDGVPGQASCAHSEFNNGVLREQWGFDGAVVTDGDGVGYLWTSYGHGAMNCGDGATGPTNAVRVGLRGGVDVELGETLNNFALEAIADGNITMSDVDLALSRTVPFLFRLGLLDPPATVRWTSLGPTDVDTAASRALAAEAATQAVVLLRNDASLVPLDATALKHVAVVGPNADNANSMLANYHGTNTIAALHTPLAAIQALAASSGGFSVTTAPGCSSVLCVDDSGFAAAVAVAAAADVVIFVGGGGPWRGGAGPFNSTEGEEFDRTNITLPGLQEDLIRAVLGAGKPVVLVIMRGSPIALSPALLADVRLSTLVDICYPGEMGGDGLAAVLFGEAAPSGRLAATVYPPSFVNTRGITDYNFTSGEGITHRYYTGIPQFPFGFGMSTTTWALTWLDGVAPDASVDAAAWAADTTSPPPYAVNATNTGTRTSDISLLAFISSGLPGDPLQELFDFQRAAAVAPGASVLLYFTVPTVAAARTGDDGSAALAAGDLAIRIGAPGDQMLATTLTVTGERTVVRAAPFAPRK